MATDDEVRRLILEVVGEDRVRKLREEIDQEKESLLKLTSTLAHLTPEEIARDKQVQASTMHLAELNAELVKAGGVHRNLGMAALEASRAMEDLQYGVGGVINNIPGLVMALGGGAGLTAVISLVAVGINQLVKHTFPEWEGGVKKIKEHHEKLTEELKRQKAALKDLEEAKPTDAGVKGVIAEHLQEMRVAVAETITAEAQADIAALPRAQRRFGPPVIEATPQTQALLAHAQRRIAGAQQQAQQILAGAAHGQLPEQLRLRQIFGPDTEIGARLAEFGPERIEQQKAEERDVARQIHGHRLEEQIQQHQERLLRKKEQEDQKAERERVALNTAQMKAIEDANKVEEQAAKAKATAANKAAAAAKREATAREHAANKAEREFLEDLKLQVDVAAARGVPAQMIGAQAGAMFQKMAAQNGQTTNLAQAQVRMMLHLQQLYEHQQQQLREMQHKTQQFWDNAFRRGR